MRYDSFQLPDPLWQMLGQSPVDDDLSDEELQRSMALDASIRERIEKALNRKKVKAE